jgi:hypothetical protein
MALEAHYTSANAYQRKAFPGCKGIVEFAQVVDGNREWVAVPDCLKPILDHAGVSYGSTVPVVGNILAWQHVRATNDTNGNPRRLFMAYLTPTGRAAMLANGFPLETCGASQTLVIEEGYDGRPAFLTFDQQLETVEVTPTELRRMRKRGDDYSRSRDDLARFMTDHANGEG